MALLSGLDIAEDLSSILCLLSSRGVFFSHFNYLLLSSVVALTLELPEGRVNPIQDEQPASFSANHL